MKKISVNWLFETFGIGVTVIQNPNLACHAAAHQHALHHKQRLTARMSAPTDTTTELMTEHLQYAPLTFIDDIINSANAILYQSMDAFEAYLRDTLIPSIPSSTSANTSTKTFNLDASQDPERELLYKELEFGMAQVETLLENAVDRNFDAFELYLLRNVFNVPDDVDGYLRLKHHQVLLV